MCATTGTVLLTLKLREHIPAALASYGEDATCRIYSSGSVERVRCLRLWRFWGAILILQHSYTGWKEYCSKANLGGKVWSPG